MKSKHQSIHHTVTALFALLMAVGLGLTAPTAAVGATHYGTVMVKTQRMSDATLKSTQHGWYNKGNKLTLKCYKRGQSVQGYYSPYVGNGGWDNLWYKVSDGYFVADIDINTGSNSPVTAACATGTPATTKASRAAAWAKSQVGSNSYPGLCERFIENAYNTSGRYASATANYNAQKAAGRIHTSGTPSLGALVFSRSSLDGGNGHVAIYVGSGRYVQGGVSTSYGSGRTVQNLSSPNPTSGAVMLGWSAAPTSWPGR